MTINNTTKQLRKIHTQALTEEDEAMLAEEKDTFFSPRSNFLPQQTIDLVMQELADETELSLVKTEAAVCILLQMGSIL